MWNNRHLDRVRSMFSDQFEPSDNAYLYRKYMKGEAFEVSAGERDQLMADFNRRLNYALWSIFPATLLLIGCLVALHPNLDDFYGQLLMWAGLALIMVPYWLTFRWAWNGPTRSLASRSPVAAAMAPEEVRRLKFQKMSYQQLGLAVGTAFLLVWKVSAKNDVLHGWGVIWLVLAGGIIIAAGVQACRKWHFERTFKG